MGVKRNPEKPSKGGAAKFKRAELLGAKKRKQQERNKDRAELRYDPHTKETFDGREQFD